MPVAFVSDRFEIALMEARPAWLAETLGVEVEGSILFYWIDDAFEFCDGSAACVHGQTIYGGWHEFDHELVHAVASPLGRAVWLREEGLTVALAGGRVAIRGFPPEWLGREASDRVSTLTLPTSTADPATTPSVRHRGRERARVSTERPFVVPTRIRVESRA